MVAGGESFYGIDDQAAAAGWDIFLDRVGRRKLWILRRSCLDQCAASDVLSHQDGVRDIGSAKNDAADAHHQSPVYLVATGKKKQSSAKAVRLKGQGGDAIDRPLKQRSVVTARRPDRQHSGDRRQRPTRLIACIRKVNRDGAIGNCGTEGRERQ